MQLKIIDMPFSICKLSDCSTLNMTESFYFYARTDEEISLVCPTEKTPANTLVSDEGWRMFRIEGTLDFSLVGILSKISGILAEYQISSFAVSTYNTDYILVKEEKFEAAISRLQEHGFESVPMPADRR
mgnify:CR=1 FL=1